MKLAKTILLIVTSLTLFTFACLAQETKFLIGPALGKDAAAYSKVFGIDSKPEEASGNAKGPTRFMWLDTVPKLGKIRLLWAPESTMVSYMDVSFPDKKITSWQMAFTKLGLTTDAKVTQQNEEFVKVTFKTENGKTCNAYFHQANNKENDGLPTIGFKIEDPK